jgi:benzoate transport
MSNNPRQIIDSNPMSLLQKVAIAITIGLNALDGFDVLSISYASPGITKEWHADAATMGWVLSMELIGMAVGSVLLGGVADKIGRRPTILGCLCVMALGMFFASEATSINELLGWRLLTGLGIGGMLASINALAAEFSNQKWRALCMAVMVIGYPLGGIFGGLAVPHLLADGGWRAIFHYGAIATAVFIPLVVLFVPESASFLERRRPANALPRINRTLSRFGFGAIDALAEPTPEARRASIFDILKPGFLSITLLATLAYAAHVITFYYILKWVPKIGVDFMHYPPPAAAGVLWWANLGGATGGAIFGLLTLRFGLKRMTMIAMVMSSLTVAWFGRGQSDLAAMSAMVFTIGLFTNSAIVGFYSIFARIFPTHVRATGTGFAIGMGRAGSAFGPALAGYLFKADMGLQTVSIIMATGSLIAAVALYRLKVEESD